MKNSQTIIAVIIALVIIIFAFVYFRKNPEAQNSGLTKDSSVNGCYVAGTDKDVYTLKIQTTEEGQKVTGTLAFKNFEKDSSSGTISGTFKDGILLGDYSFRSEGMDSVMQVIFKKQGEDFVRGYGGVSNEGTKFSDLNAITYDATSPLSVFKKVVCS